jgi:uncharacterized protein (DUF58 family)
VIVPSARLIWLTAAAGFPLAVAGAVAPEARVAAEVCGAALAAAVGVDALLRSRALAGVRIELPEMVRFFKDRAGEIRVRLHNPSARGRRVAVGMVAPAGIDAEAEEQRVDLPDGAAAAEFAWRCMPRRRGRYAIDSCYLEAPSTLGFWLVRQCMPVALEIRVYPNLRGSDDLKALRRGVDGVHALRQLGRGREFEKLREYIAGDGYDEIHWKATARRGRPVTKVFQVERTQEVYVVIDASRLAGRITGGDETTLERSLSAALILGAAAERRGDLFGLAAFARNVEAFTRARNGKAHYAACRDAIYRLEPRSASPDFDEIATFLRLRLRRRALLLFLTALDDPVVAENFQRATRLLSRRHLVVAVALQPPGAKPLFQGGDVESIDDVYRHLAGHLTWRHLRELEVALGRQGVRLALVEPAVLSTGLVRLYDEVKQRQLL